MTPVPAFRFSPRPNAAAQIQWREWGSAAFAEAGAQAKPVLLAISAVWCHWCHVMDETTYSDPAVIGRINRDFIPVRVDNDQRPDVNARYNQGGWPTAAFLSAGGELLTGATYVPPEPFLRALEQVSSYYREHRDDVEAPKAPPRPVAAAPTEGEPEAGLLEDLVRGTLGQFDVRYGGFGQGQKFPHAATLAQLVAYVAGGGSQAEALRPDLVRTLDAMAQGEMLDRVAGGFFRYCTQRDWRVPHFEKMLEDNAGLLAVYADAAAVLEAPRYLDVVRSVLRFLDEVLWDPHANLYRGSQDADETYFGLDAAGRERLPAPYVDPVLYASWNGLAVRALYRASAALGDPAPAERATQAAEALAQRFVEPSGSVAHYDAGGGPSLRGLLADQVAVASALAVAHQATGRADFLDAALRAWRWSAGHLLGPGGAFLDHAGTQGSEGALALPFEPLPDNGAAVELALGLEALTADGELREAARLLLLALQPQAARISAEGGGGVLFAGEFASALQSYLAPPFEVHLVARPLEGRVLAAAALGGRLPSPSVAWVDPTDASALAARGYPAHEKPTAYACYRWTCLPPVESVSELEDTLRQLRERGSRLAEVPPA